MPRQPRLKLNYPAKATRRPTPQEELATVKLWNDQWPVGIPCTVEMDSGIIRKTITRSEAYMLGAEPSKGFIGHTAVVFLEGISGAYLLSRVRPSGQAVRKGAV